MAARTTATATRETVEEIPLARYLAERAPVPHLYELTGPPEPTDHDDGAASTMVSMVRAHGDRETDVRLLVDDGERHLHLARELAEGLHCDVYLTPSGAVVRYVHAVDPVAGETWDAVAVDAASGLPVDWLVVRPADLPAGAPTWFMTVRGRLRRGRGLVTVALPDGVAFATRASYRVTTALAARLMASRQALTTVAVNAETGLFEIARFEDEPVDPRAAGPAPRRRLFNHGREQTPELLPRPPATLLPGAEFASLVRACIDVIHPDVQVALTWPNDAAACTRLHEELLALAEGLGRTVWVPEPPGAAFVLPGFGEIVAVDEVGAPSRWRAYPPSSAANLTTRFGTDLDGRLTPLGEAAGARFHGVRFVSVPPAQLEHLRRWYQAIAPSPGLFPIDLTVLPDGRLGVMLAHGAAVVAGPRELQVLLREAGWRGEELLLLAQPSAEVWNTTIDHARGLVEGLRTDLWLATLDAQLWVQADGTLAADGPDGTDHAWVCVAFGSTAANVTLPAALAVPRLSDDGRVVPRPTPAPPALGSAPADVPALAALAATLALPAPVADPYGLDSYSIDDLTQQLPAAPVSPAPPARPASAPAATGGLGRALGTEAPHGVPWLVDSPTTNPREIDLYLWTPLPDDEIEAWGLPSADMFLLAGQDPLRLADHRPTGSLLRLRVPPHAAVDALAHAKQAPAALQQRLGDTGTTHLLPLAWLRDLRVTARFDLDGAGGVRNRSDVGIGALAIRFEGAEHGVAGLPNDVVHWPDRGSRADAPCYVLLPEESDMSLSVIHGGFVALSRRKPALEDGCRVLEVRVRRRRAIDIPATLDGLAGLSLVGRVHDFVGLDLLLPEVDLDKAVVTKIWRHGTGHRPVVDKLGGQTLYDALLDETILAGERALVPA